MAAAAHPDRGSEPGLGWGWVEALSTHHDLWVITGEREGNREAIERRLAEVPGLGERLKVFFVPRPDGPWFERVFPPWYYGSTGNGISKRSRWPGGWPARWRSTLPTRST